MIKIYEEQYKNFGNCMVMTNGDIFAKVTIDLGPRIIYYGTADRNIMFEDIDRVVNKDGEYFDTNFKAGERWNIYGGHRLWKSPEALDSYVPDNYPVQVDKLANGAIFTQAVQKMTGIKAAIEVNMNDDGSLKVAHSFLNTLDHTIQASMWGLTVLKHGGLELIPSNDEDTGLLSNRNYVFWPYSDILDKRFELNNEYITLAQDTNNTRAFKLGMRTDYGALAYFVDDLRFTLRVVPEDLEYPDKYCNIETYTNNHILEMETLSPLYDIKSGAEVTHTEYWSLDKNVARPTTHADKMRERALLVAKK